MTADRTATDEQPEDDRRVRSEGRRVVKPEPVYDIAHLGHVELLRHRHLRDAQRPQHLDLLRGREVHRTRRTASGCSRPTCR